MSNLWETKMKNLEISKEALEAAKLIASTPAEAGKALAALTAPTTPERKSKTAKPKSDKPTSKEAEKTKREIKAFQVIPVESQTEYEQRYYMRDYHHDEKADIVRHATNYGILSAAEAALKYMLRIHKKKPEVTTFKTGDLINGVDSFGPSYGDCLRNAMRKLEKAGIVKIHKLEGERAKYAFELVKFDIKPGILAVSQKPEKPAKKSKKGETSQKTKEKPAEAPSAPATTPEPVPATAPAEPVVSITPA